MQNTVKKIFFSICFVLLCGCSKNDTKHNEGAITPGEKTEYNSPFTSCEVNEDGTYKLTIFSSNKLFKGEQGYQAIDNSIIKSENSDFEFENKGNQIKACMPLKISQGFKVKKEDLELLVIPETVDAVNNGNPVDYVNIYGDTVSAVQYSSEKINYILYPSYSGIRMEVEIKENIDFTDMKFEVNTMGSCSFENGKGYLLFSKDEKKTAAIYNAMVKYPNDPFIKYNNMWKKGKKTNNITILKLNLAKLKLDQNSSYPVTIELAFDIPVNSLPDSSIYSKDENNCYLNNYAMIGEDQALGEGWEYFRLRLNWFAEINPKTVIEANFYIKNLSKEEAKMQMQQINQQWLSSEINWKQRIEGDQMICEESELTEGGWYKFKITQFVKQCLKDKFWEKEYLGGVIQATNGKTILATSDNSLYFPYVELKLSEKPEKFYIRDRLYNE